MASSLLLAARPVLVSLSERKVSFRVAPILPLKIVLREGQLRLSRGYGSGRLQSHDLVAANLVAAVRPFDWNQPGIGGSNAPMVSIEESLPSLDETDCKHSTVTL
jgi:hypothetical protein